MDNILERRSITSEDDSTMATPTNAKPRPAPVVVRHDDHGSSEFLRLLPAALGSAVFHALLFGALFLMSQLLQTGLGYSPLQAGVRLLPWTLPPMIVAPIAGVLADRYGNRPFMVLGLALQAAGYAWVALIVAPGIDYSQLGVAFTVAGIGTSFCFPTVANAIMGAVPMPEAGTASGINSALRELGGVVGVTVLASVFIHHGGYTNQHADRRIAPGLPRQGRWSSPSRNA